MASFAADIYKPNFFIVGAPKCGTTSLNYYLQQHPNIFMAKKELYFFGSDFTFREGPTELDYYLSFFKNAKRNQLIGEASVWYLFSKKAAAEIKKFNKQAKILIMLRSPVDMLYSLHSEQLFNGNENIDSFEEAIKAETKRKKGELIPPYIGCPIEALQYRQIGKYYQQVKRYIDKFGKEQVHIIFMNDFANNTEMEFTKVLNFLDLATVDEFDFEVKNTNKKSKNEKLRDILKSRPTALKRIAKAIIPVRNWRHKLTEKLWELNTINTNRIPINEETKTKLNKYFEPDILKLQELIGKDLGYWLK